MSKSGDDAGSNGPGSQAEARRGAQGAAIEADDSQVVAAYANFCRVHATPEELVVDFGMNLQSAPPQQPIKLTQRVVVNYFTAKKLVGLLHMAVQRHEAAFGVIETDVQKRVTKS